MFTIRHILWLIICAVLISGIIIYYRKKRPDMDRILMIAFIIAILSEAEKMVGVIELVPSKSGELMLPYLPMNHLPMHFCSIQIILIAVVKFSQNEKLKETLLAFMAPTCTIGGIMALLMPSIFTTSIPVQKAFTSIISYQFFIFHTMIISLGLIIACSDKINWSMKHFKSTLLIVYLLGLISIYLNSMLASPTYADGKLVSVDFWTNFFFTYQNPIGIRITQMWQWYLYLLIIALLAAVLIYLFYLPLIKRKKKNKEAEK